MPSVKSATTFCFILLMTLVLHESVIAQQEEPKIEAGAQLSVLGRSASIGGGGRLTFNLTRNLALEGELNYFPSSGSDNTRIFQGQFGVKAGLRFDRFGVFGKVRPGFINSQYNVTVFCPPPVCPPGQVCIPRLPSPCSVFTATNTKFSSDLGAVVEFYPAKRVVVRFDVGDTITNRRAPSVPLDIGQFAIISSNVATHNLQVSASVGFRF